MGQFSYRTLLFTPVLALSSLSLPAAAGHDFQKINEALDQATSLVAEKSEEIDALDVAFDAAATDMDTDTYTLDTQVTLKPPVAGLPPVLVARRAQIKIETNADTKKERMLVDSKTTIHADPIAFTRLSALRYKQTRCQDLKVLKVWKLGVAEKCAHIDELAKVKTLTELEAFFAKVKTGVLGRLDAFLVESQLIAASSKTDLTSQKMAAMTESAQQMHALFEGLTTRLEGDTLVTYASGGSMESHVGDIVTEMGSTFAPGSVVVTSKSYRDLDLPLYSSFKPQIHTILTALEETNALAIEMVKANMESFIKLYGFFE